MYRYRAWLVVNHFVHAEKFETLYNMLTRAAEASSVKLERKTNAELLVDFSVSAAEPRPDFVLFWDKDVNLCRHLENQGLRVFNNSYAIETCDNKNRTALALETHPEIPTPRTILAPKTFRPDRYPDVSFLNEVGERLKFPLVVKEAFGSFGFQVHLAQNLDELTNIVAEIGTRPMQFQKFVRSERHGVPSDVRLHVAGGEVVAAVMRTAKKGDFRANVTNGGAMHPYTPTEAETALAIRVCDVLKIDFAGVDLLFGSEQDEPILCEVNTNAHFKNLYDVCGIDVGPFIFRHILNVLSSSERGTNE